MSVCVCVCLSVCPHKPFVHDSDRNFCRIFLKFGTWDTHVKTTTKFGGQVHRVNAPPFTSTKPLFGENLKLNPMESISESFLTTDKAVITKLGKNIKQIEFYKKM